MHKIFVFVLLLALPIVSTGQSEREQKIRKVEESRTNNRPINSPNNSNFNQGYQSGYQNGYINEYKILPNPIKYNTSTESNALKSGNFWIGTGDVSKGPTSITGYWNGITPPAGGYTVYLNKASNGPSISVCSNDADLIDLTNRISGQNYTTVSECLSYFSGQLDKVCFNRDYEGIVTDGLVLNLDAGYAPSYPKNGTTWYDLSGNGNNGTLVNGPTFDSGNDGSILFDGSDDRVILNSTITFSSDFTFTFFGYLNVLPTPTSRQVYISGSNNWIEQSDRDTLFLVNSSPTQQSINLELPSNLLSQDTIYSISLVRKPNYTFDFYYNGTLQTLRSSPTQTITQNFSFNNLSKSFRVFNGGMFIVNLHNRALSAAEILQNYNAQKNRFGL